MRVVLGEDLTLLRDGLIRLLGAYDMEVVEAVDNGPELLDALVRQRLDVAVVDVRLPPTFTEEGLRAAIEARRRVHGLPVLVLSQHVEQLYARELMAHGTGGLGYLLKDRVSDVARFIEAVRTVAAGGTAIDPEVVAQLMARHARDELLGRLTPREREVLALMAEGRTNMGIASRLVVTEKAISKHINNIFLKLGLYQAEDDNRRVLAVLTYLNALRAGRGEQGLQAGQRHRPRVTGVAAQGRPDRLGARAGGVLVGANGQEVNGTVVSQPDRHDVMRPPAASAVVQRLLELQDDRAQRIAHLADEDHRAGDRDTGGLVADHR